MYRTAAAALPETPLGKAITHLVVLVAHPDDETGGCAGLLQRVAHCAVVYATDAAPADPCFWGRYASREGYAQARRREARSALAMAGVHDVAWLREYATAQVRFADQQLHTALSAAWPALCNLVRRHQPNAILVPAYEGGHPDHDCCSFLGFLLRCHFGLAVWEMPLYHRSASGELVCRRFRDATVETVLHLRDEEKRIRDMMVASYRSQRDLADYVFGGEERFRPQHAYDYSCPPHPGTVNYEAWQWPISPSEVSRKFIECLAHSDIRELERLALPASAVSATAAGAENAGTAT